VSSPVGCSISAPLGVTLPGIACGQPELGELLGNINRAEADRSSSVGCDHKTQTETVTAGLRRLVCEQCGHVSIRFEEDTVRIRQENPAPPERYEEPDLVVDLTTQPRVKLPGCTECGSTAKFFTPIGVACSYHAWEAASDQEGIEDEFWIPILIDRNAL